MICTLKYLRERFRAFNALCFESSLTEPHLRIGHSRHRLGSIRYKCEKTLFGGVRYKDITLSISAFYDLSEQELEDTILHEMIHLYIISHRKKDTSTHGVLFRQMMQEINQRFERHITISHRGALQQSARKNHQNIIAITKLKDGQTCVTRPSKTRILYINNQLMRVVEVKSVEWYNSSDPYFDTFPRSLKLKLYCADREALEHALKDAIPLKITSSGITRLK